MAENDKDYKSNGGNDSFTRFMFGNSKKNDLIDEKEDHSQVKSEPKNNSDDWFFGNRRRVQEKKTTTNLNQIENTLKNVDLELLMETMHMFMTTSNQYKPIIKEVSPFFNRFLKKFKSNTD